MLSDHCDPSFPAFVVNIGTNTSWPIGCKTVFMLNSTEHEISTAHKMKIQTNKEVSC